MTDPLEALRLLFAARCADDLAALRRANAEWDVVEVGRIAHRLAGSAGSFGFSEVSRLALIVDEAFREGAVGHALPLSELIVALDAMQAQPVAGAPPE